ncbi:unnamed protein product, partial [Coregonus sp. 'balchen']
FVMEVKVLCVCCERRGSSRGKIRLHRERGNEREEESERRRGRARVVRACEERESERGSTPLTSQADWLARSLLTNELSTHTGQKKTQEKKDGSRRMSFQRPKGTVEYAVSLFSSRFSLVTLHGKRNAVELDKPGHGGEEGGREGGSEGGEGKLVETRDTLNNIALKFDTTPNELVQLNKLFSRAVLYVPDPEHISSVGSSPSLSPISPLSPTSSEADLEKVT